MPIYSFKRSRCLLANHGLSRKFVLSILLALSVSFNSLFVTQVFADNKTVPLAELQTLLQLEQYAQAVNVYSKFYDRVPQQQSDPLRQQLFMYTRSAIDSGRCHQAIVLMSEFTRVFYRNSDAHLFLADCHVQMGNNLAEVNALLAAFAGDYDYANHDALSVRIKSRVQKYLNSEPDPLQRANLLQETITLIPDQAYYYLQLAEAYVALGRIQDALLQLEYIVYDPSYGTLAEAKIAQLKHGGQTSSPIAGIHLKKSGAHFLVDVIINRTERATLLIDTGASLTTLKPQFLRRLNLLGGNEQYITLNTANGTVNAPLVQIKEIKIGNYSVSPIAVAGVSLEGQPEIDGLLGMNLLGKFEFQIDQQRQLLLINTQE